MLFRSWAITPEGRPVNLGEVLPDDDGDMKEVSEALCNALIDAMIEVVEAHGCSCMVLFDVKEQEND